MKDLGRPLKPLHSPLKPLARSSNYSDTDTDTDINTRTTSAQSAVQPQSADDIWGDDEADPPPQVPESVKSINDTMFTTYGRFMNGEEIELAKELIKRHYPARVSKELRTVARSREPPSAPMNYIHSYLKDQNTRSAKKGAGQIITEFEEVEY
jgi:hypothetical protein